ncbi:hypothetical protein [Pedobacter faecalis]|uniref:hypothetical protein n=1 Tax=Pedobacter faecalis TaxID=3041495 RepID=UPI00254DFC12|nr:hypothetical protein [Pedobacter sp. ELA7]
MKKILIIPVVILFLSAKPSNIDTNIQSYEQIAIPLSTKLDSINSKASELRDLLEHNRL